MKPSPTPVPHYRWNELPQEPLRGTISRRVVTGERMMIAHVYLKKNDDVPRHSHENEQITYVLERAVREERRDHDDLAGAHGELLGAVFAEPEMQRPLEHVGDLLVLVRGPP